MIVSTYTGAKHELFVEAMRTVVALAAARLRDSQADIDTLLEAYSEEAQRRGVTVTEAWSILAVAGLIWTTNLVTASAEERGLSPDDVVREMVDMGVEWAADGEP